MGGQERRRRLQYVSLSCNEGPVSVPAFLSPQEQRSRKQLVSSSGHRELRSDADVTDNTMWVWESDAVTRLMNTRDGREHLIEQFSQVWARGPTQNASTASNFTIGSDSAHGQKFPNSTQTNSAERELFHHDLWHWD